MKNSIDQKLHLGCGTVRPKGWVNADGSWNARLSNYPFMRRIARRLGILPREQYEVDWSGKITILDVRKRLPFSDGTISVVYASHLLEHLYHSEAISLLKELHRVLSPGGIIRIVVPDIKTLVEGYTGVGPLANREGTWSSDRAADRLNEGMLFKPASPPSSSVLYKLYSNMKDFHSHKWMYDAESLTRHVREAGFSSVAEKEYLESDIGNLQDVERAERVLNGEGICVEGVK
jgi:predicted SAM-dependent methyltransferase